MSDREYVLKLLDEIPEERLGDVISFLMKIDDEDFDKVKFDLAKDYILEKYREAFRELAR